MYLEECTSPTLGSIVYYSYITYEKALQEICYTITQILLRTIMLDQHFSFLYVSCSTLT